jgi:hypothetical protein
LLSEKKSMENHTKWKTWPYDSYNAACQLTVTSEGKQDNVGQESARIHACLLVYDETWRKEIYQFENNKISLNHMHVINSKMSETVKGVSKMSETVKGVESPGSWSAATEFVAGIRLPWRGYAPLPSAWFRRKRLDGYSCLPPQRICYKN